MADIIPVRTSVIGSASLDLTQIMAVPESNPKSNRREFLKGAVAGAVPFFAAVAGMFQPGCSESEEGWDPGLPPGPPNVWIDEESLHIEDYTIEYEIKRLEILDPFPNNDANLILAVDFASPTRYSKNLEEIDALHKTRVSPTNKVYVLAVNKEGGVESVVQYHGNLKELTKSNPPQERPVIRFAFGAEAPQELNGIYLVSTIQLVTSSGKGLSSFISHGYGPFDIPAKPGYTLVRTGYSRKLVRDSN